MSDVNKNDCLERVALELAEKVYGREKGTTSVPSLTAEEAREYWFKLYYQSLRIVKGEFPDRVLPKSSEK